MNEDVIIASVLKRSMQFKVPEPQDEGKDLYYDGEKIGRLSIVVDGMGYISHRSGTREMIPMMQIQAIYEVPIDGDEEKTCLY